MVKRLPHPAASFDPIPVRECSHALRMRCPPVLDMGLMDLGDFYPGLKGLMVPWELELGPGFILCVDCHKYEKRATRQNRTGMVWERFVPEPAGGQA